MTGPVKDAINQLIDLRLVHLVQSRVTLKKGADGLVFEAYMLDTSQYTASRKVRDLNLIDLNSKTFSEEIRKKNFFTKVEVIIRGVFNAS